MDDARFALDGMSDHRREVRRQNALKLVQLMLKPDSRRLLKSAGLLALALNAALDLPLEAAPSPALGLAAGFLIYSAAVASPSAADIAKLTGPGCANALRALLAPFPATAGVAREEAEAEAAAEAEVRAALTGMLPLAPGEPLDCVALALLVAECCCLMPATAAGGPSSRLAFKAQLLQSGCLDAVVQQAWAELQAMRGAGEGGRPHSAGRLMRCLRVLEQAAFESGANQLHLVRWAVDQGTAARLSDACCSSPDGLQLGAPSSPFDVLGDEEGEGCGLQHALHEVATGAVSRALSWLDRRPAGGEAAVAAAAPPSPLTAPAQSKAAGREGGCSTSARGARRTKRSQVAAGLGDGGGPPPAGQASMEEAQRSGKQRSSGRRRPGTRGAGRSSGRLAPGSSAPEDARPARREPATFVALLVDSLPELAAFSAQLSEQSAPPQAQKAARACLRYALNVLTNLTNDIAEGCEAVACDGGLTIAAGLLQTLSAASFGTGLDAGASSGELKPPADDATSGDAADAFNSLLCLLINTVEYSSEHAGQLAALRLGGDHPQLLAAWLGALFSRAFALAAGPQGCGPPALTAQLHALGDATAMPALGGVPAGTMIEEESEREAQSMIAQAYLALLLAVLLRGRPDVQAATIPMLPGGSVHELSVVLERFCRFHTRVNATTDRAADMLQSLLASLRELH